MIENESLLGTDPIWFVVERKQNPVMAISFPLAVATRSFVTASSLIPLFASLLVTKPCPRSCDCTGHGPLARLQSDSTLHSPHAQSIRQTRPVRANPREHPVVHGRLLIPTSLPPGLPAAHERSLTQTSQSRDPDQSVVHDLQAPSLPMETAARRLRRRAPSCSRRGTVATPLTLLLLCRQAPRRPLHVPPPSPTLTQYQSSTPFQKRRQPQEPATGKVRSVRTEAASIFCRWPWGSARTTSFVVRLSIGPSSTSRGSARKVSLPHASPQPPLVHLVPHGRKAHRSRCHCLQRRNSSRGKDS